MPILEISIVPVGTKRTSLSRYVASAIELLRKEKNIKFKLTAMGTIIESDSIDTLFEVSKKLHVSAFSKSVKRVVTSIKIDDRIDKIMTSDGKTRAVLEKLS